MAITYDDPQADSQQIDGYNYAPDDDLIEKIHHGGIAEQQLQGMPQNQQGQQGQQDPDQLQHHAALLLMAATGRQACDTFLQRLADGLLSEDNAWVVDMLKQRQQEDQDKYIVQGLSAGKFIILSQEAVQQLTQNANARFRVQNSDHLDPDQIQEVVSKTFEDDANIRRSAMPIPPEVLGQSPMVKKNQLLQQLPPQDQQKPWQYDPNTGNLRMPLGYKEPDPIKDATAVRQHVLDYMQSLREGGNHTEDDIQKAGQQEEQRLVGMTGEPIQPANGQQKPQQPSQPNSLSDFPHFDANGLRTWYPRPDQLDSSGKLITQPQQAVGQLPPQQDHGQQNPPKIASNAEWKKLPDGSAYTWKDGKVYTKGARGQAGPVDVRSMDEFDKLPVGTRWRWAGTRNEFMKIADRSSQQDRIYKARDQRRQQQLDARGVPKSEQWKWGYDSKTDEVKPISGASDDRKARLEEQQSEFQTRQKEGKERSIQHEEDYAEKQNDVIESQLDREWKEVSLAEQTRFAATSQPGETLGTWWTHKPSVPIKLSCT